MEDAVAVPSVRAEMVTTDRVLELQADGAARERVLAFLAREEVQRELAQLGVDPGVASRRAAALSDAEIEQIAGRLDEASAGQFFGMVVNAAVLVFLVLLATDLLCLTTVFPFARCATTI